MKSAGSVSPSLAISRHLQTLADPVIAEHSQRFFKTGRGQYGEGDKFLGIRVPVLRKLISQYRNVSVDETVLLLASEYHEERLFALLMLVRMFTDGDAKRKEQIYKMYLRNIKHINNWDLVDSSASQIVGAYLDGRDKDILYDLAGSESLWQRRIAIMATFYFIRKDQFGETLRIATMLMDDREDLIHKAVGWMLREVGKRDMKLEKEFLKKHLDNMPRTMLRYAIERFSDMERKAFLTGNVET